MTIRTGVDLGASFEILKNSMKEAEKIRIGNGIEGLTKAYSKLLANTEFFVKEFDDEGDSPDDLPKELFTAPSTH